MSVAHDWLRSLYATTEDGWLTLFAVDRTTGQKHTRWHRTDAVEAMAADAERLAATCCVWFGVATREAQLGGRRGTGEECTFLPALWVDIDVAGAVHAADDLPPDHLSALDLVLSFPIHPTAIVDSGHGLQAWWVLSEPAAVDGRTKALLADWGHTWAEMGRREGWHVDNVFDVARVMRLPGTFNRKAEPVEVRVVEADWNATYGLDDLEQFTLDAPQPDPLTASKRTVPYIGPERPGDAYNATEDAGAILERYGFHPDHVDHDGNRHYRAPHRPGRTESTGATVYADDGHATIWSETFARANGLKVRRPYDPFGLITALEHGGDFAAATRALSEAGYGTPDVDLTLAPGHQAASAALPPPSNLPEEFWAERPELAHIRQAAHARARSADAVLGAVLARISAMTSPGLMLPAPVGVTGTLDFAVAIIGRSGAGKSSSAEVAAELLPILGTDPLVVPLGSGEGLIEAYLDFVTEDDDDGKKRKVKRQVRQSVLAMLDEGQALAEMGARKGSTLMPTIRTAWSGGRLGQANASEERKRFLPAREYRMALIAGFQLEHATTLIDDAAGGTPQRFVFVAAEDPTVPDEAPDWPGVLDWIPTRHDRGPMGMDATISAEIRARALAVTRGEVAHDPLDSHRDLLRMKVAGLLAYLDRRTDIDLDDWRLAGMILTTSEKVRSSIIAAARERARQAEQAVTLRRVRQEAAVDDDASTRALKSMAKSISRHVHKHGGGCKRGCMSQATAHKHRQLATVDDAIELAVREGWIAADGDVYRPGKAAA